MVRIVIRTGKLYNGFLPNVSDSGASINGPTPSITTKSVWHSITPSVVVWRDSAIYSIPGANIELERGLRTGYLVRRKVMEGERGGGGKTLDMDAITVILASFFRSD
ncbi:hypothetical protein IFR05_013204 [Cadophora sp. M221]|nr:hypothetical protein IFR05_013204 [Cadophora sp. M221]